MGTSILRSSCLPDCMEIEWESMPSAEAYNRYMVDSCVTFNEHTNLLEQVYVKREARPRLA